jgi:hypothetical protein
MLVVTGALGFGAEIWQKARQRKSFKETRKAFEVKCVIDEQSKKQVRVHAPSPSSPLVTPFSSCNPKLLV